jgi:hypothetical protein
MKPLLEVSRIVVGRGGSIFANSEPTPRSTAASISSASSREIRYRDWEARMRVPSRFTTS